MQIGLAAVLSGAPVVGIFKWDSAGLFDGLLIFDGLRDLLAPL